MPPYLLRTHVHACLSGGQLVLLDLRADRYFALEAAEAAALAPLVRGWPVSAADAAGGDETMARELLERSLLTQNESAGKPATPVVIESVATELTVDGGVPHLGARRIAAALVATARAAIVLRCWSLVRIVRRVSRRKSLYHGTGSSSLERTRDLTMAFEYLRPFLYSPRDACLFDCLTLTEFLAMHGVFPTWVFGVRAKPFAAHCWLQHEGVLLNDSVVRTGSFTPIMTV